MPATIRLTRKLFGIELRRGTFDILVDGERVGSIERDETIDTAIDPGRHALQVRRGRYASRVETFETDDGEVAEFRCHGARIWPTWLASFVVPGLAISLSRE